MLSKKRESFDGNKFYLISDVYKVRLRPIDLKFNYVAHTLWQFDRLTDNAEASGQNAYKFKPEIKDTFLDYSKEGYEDISAKLDFGTKTNPDARFYYFDHKPVRANTIDVYFVVPEEFARGTLYYGDQELTVFEVN